MELYREIQTADKIVHVHVHKTYVEALVKELDPTRMMLQTECDTIAEAEALLDTATRWVR